MTITFQDCLNRDSSRRFTLGDALVLADAAAPLSEVERRKLSKAVVEKWKQPISHWNYSGKYHDYLELAVLAVGPFSAVKKIESFYEFEPAALKILCDRRPDWLEQWLTLQLSKDFPRISWWFYRELLRARVIPKPNSEGYVRFLARLTGASEPWTSHASVKRSAYLLQNSEFIDDLWRFFDVESQVFSTFLSTPGSWEGDQAYEDWPTTLLRLSDAGLMDRSRLLTSTLRALNSDFSSAALTGFARFYERLNPTLDEQVAAQASYRDLLTSRTSHVVKLALGEFASLQKNNRLVSAAFLAAAPAVFALRPKSHPQTVLSIASKVAKQQPELTTEAANLAIEALAHESSDVQGPAVKLLESWQARLHRDHASELRARLDGIAASIRPRVQALINGLDATESCGEDSPAPSSFSLNEWKTRAAAIPAPWRSLAGVDDALGAAENDDLFRGIWFNVNYVPVLTSCAPIVPIATVDELLDAVAHAVEVIETADELERILDGISRLCDQRPADFEHRAKPIAKRLLAERRDVSRGILGFTMTPKLHQLLLRWLGASGQVRFQAHEDLRALSKFVEHRLREIEARIAVHKSVPLLSAPTHQHGWLDPRVFIKRLGSYTMTSPPIADLIQALLRLAPDHRATALASVPELPNEIAAVVRFALGGPSPTGASSIDDRFSLWLAAGRSRQAFGSLSELMTAAGAEHADLLTETKFNWEVVDDDPSIAWGRRDGVGVRISAEPKHPRADTTALRPTLSFREENNNRSYSFANHSPEWCHMLANVWPANLDGLMAEGIFSLGLRINSPNSSLEPNHLYLQPLLQPDRPWNELTWLALWIALVSKDAGSRGMAIDVLIAGIEDGRAEVTCDVLLKLMQGPWLKLNRLAEAGREISRVSPRHAWWWAELLQRLLFHLPGWPTDTHHLLALLLELLTELQLGLRDQVRPRFEAQQPTGKAAKLKKALLTLVLAPGSAARQRAQELALEAVLQRAERWRNGASIGGS